MARWSGYAVEDRMIALGATGSSCEDTQWGWAPDPDRWGCFVGNPPARPALASRLRRLVSRPLVEESGDTYTEQTLVCQEQSRYE
jgi:hypothetical protein